MMAEGPFEAPRWQPGSLQPTEVYRPPGYESRAEGEVRRAALRDADGRTLGHVWTDDRRAAGFLPVQAAGNAGIRAASRVWAVHRRSAKEGVPASRLLDPALYAPYRLDAE